MKEIKIGLVLLMVPVVLWGENVTAHRDIPYAMPEKVRQTLGRLYDDTKRRVERSTRRSLDPWRRMAARR